jgi:chromosome segregation ATPase
MSKSTAAAAQAEVLMNESDRLTAVRDLLFGENMAEYEHEFSQIRNQLRDFQSLTEQKLVNEIAALSEKLDAMEHSFNKVLKELNKEIDNNIERLDGVCNEIVSNRQEVGSAMAQIAETLQK